MLNKICYISQIMQKQAFIDKVPQQLYYRQFAIPNKCDFQIIHKSWFNRPYVIPRNFAIFNVEAMVLANKMGYHD
jgi:hypothetical protein